MWSDADEDVVIRTTVGNNDEISGISDGNCECLCEYANDEKKITCFSIVGNVKNKEDVNKFLRDKTWTIDDCLPNF